MNSILRLVCISEIVLIQEGGKYSLSLSSYIQLKCFYKFYFSAVVLMKSLLETLHQIQQVGVNGKLH